MIIFLSSSPFLGGAEYQLLDLISGLTGKYRLKLICPSSSPLRARLRGQKIDIETIELGSTLGKFRGLNLLDPGNIARIRKLKKVIFSEKTGENNILITCDYKELLLISKVKGSIKHIHIQHPQFPSWLILNPILKVLVVNSMNQTDRVVVDCFAVKKHLQKFGVREDKMEIIYNGIDENMFVPITTEEKSRIKRKFGLADKHVIGINARINAGKGYETLVTAFKQIKAKSPNSYLVSVGGGNPYVQKKINSQISSLGLSDTVSFFGEWNRSRTPDFYKSIDVFVLPSETEGLPLSVIEAMLSGLPVVATTVGGIPEEVVNNETGFLIQPKDSEQLANAIIKLLKNRSLATKMGQKGREIALAKFNKYKMIKNTLGLVTELGVKK